MGVAYPNFKLETSGGTGALSFALINGKIPSGLSQDPAGNISGNPTKSIKGAGQPVSFTKVTGSLGAVESSEVTITIFK